MPEFQAPYIYFCLGNFLFVTTCVICSIIRWNHVCHEYRDREDYYFPARKIVSFMLAVQIFQLFYVFNVNSDASLLFVSLFGVLVIPPFFVMMEKRYYFFSPLRIKELLLHFLFPSLIFVVYVYGVFAEDILITDYIVEFKILATLCCFVELYMVVKCQLHIQEIVRQRYEMEYSDINGFPTVFADNKKWITFGWSLVLLLVLWTNSRWVKFGVDLFLTITVVRFVITILDSQRESIDNAFFDMEECCEENSKRRVLYLSEMQRKELETQIIELLEQQKIFRQTDLSLDILVKMVGGNRTYISETIALSQYGSFYKMINHFRLEYVKCRLKETPDTKIEQLAFDSGFSSRYTLARTFKEFYGMTPTEWKKTESLLFEVSSIEV